MKKSILVLIFLSFLFSCSSRNGGGSYEQSYQSAELTIMEKEQLYPNDFLSISNGTYRKNLLGEWVMEGSIQSKASQITYKDIDVTISYYTKTKSYLGSETFTVYEYVQPNNRTSFKLKSFGYKNTELVDISISDASYN